MYVAFAEEFEDLDPRCFGARKLAHLATVENAKRLNLRYLGGVRFVISALESQRSSPADGRRTPEVPGTSAGLGMDDLHGNSQLMHPTCI